MERLSQFIREVRAELKKVSWPSRTQLRESTVVVLITVAILAVFTAIVDRIFSFIVGFLM